MVLPANEQVVGYGRGIQIVRATAAIPQTAAADIFTITVGRVLVTAIIGIVTVQIGAVANATNLVFVIAGGAATNLCATLDINARDVGTMFGITGTVGDAMLGVDVGGYVSGMLNNGIALEPGAIQVNCAGNDGGGGRVQWTLWYQQLEAAAVVAAA